MQKNMDDISRFAEDDISRFAEIVEKSNKLVFFGGAGVSTASGIPDFRSADGIYSERGEIPPETILSGDFFTEHTEQFYKFYKSKMLFPNAKPNAAHFALAKLERDGKDVTVITQNIDNLHQEAGSKNVIELHGSVHRNYCTHCGAFYPLDYILSSDGVPKCKRCGGVIKPDVVLYGESLDQNSIVSSARAVADADTMIVGGTSLSVYPAASFVYAFKGKNLIVINKTATPADGMAFVLRGDIAQIFSKINQ